MSWNDLPEYVRLIICIATGAVLMILILIILCQCIWIYSKGKGEDETDADDEYDEVADIAPHRHLKKNMESKKEKWKSESIRSKTSLSSSGSEGYGSLKSDRDRKKDSSKRPVLPSSVTPHSLGEIQFLQCPEIIQEPGSMGSVELSLSYEKAGEKMRIRVISAHNLKARSCGRLNSYIRVSLHRRGTETPDFQYRTKIQPTTVDPDYNETFEANITSTSLPRYVLKLVVCDYHRLGQSDLIGEAEIRLKGVDWQEGFEKEMPLNQSTQIPYGEMLVSLTYLPTSERLYVTILRSTGFRNAHDPFVRLSLVFTGKNLKKRRIALTQRRPTIAFEEALYFEVPRDVLDRVHILVVVMETQEEEDVEGARAEKELGQILLGRNCSHNAHAHWEEMKLLPRIPIAQWYPIFQEL